MAEKNPNGIKEWKPKEHGLKNDIMAGFRFSVYVNGVKMGFSKISNMETLIETEPLIEGGVNEYPHSLRKPVSREKTLVMQRGISASSMNSMMLGRIMRFNVGQRMKMDMIITVNGRNGGVEKLYKVQGALVKRWKCSDLDAMSGVQPMIETFEVVYEKMEEEQSLGMLANAIGIGSL